MNVELFNFDTPAHTARNHPERLGHQTCVGRGISAVALAIAQCVIISMCATLPNAMDHIAVYSLSHA